ncbi:LysR family transcriptional regulator [Phreatobacter oligotrophus]|uniref:LysR family transcriptional regulator n=2 Tax=Phreatobacter oligotrophus TaxID=1122261 RepID=A0A2T4YZ25_9HYPH|nr:LysR family transcriptional regulator [Phreatobacter oligotrophus]
MISICYDWAMRTLDADAVEAFILVADLGSFTRAAAVLNTTQAAVSLRIRRLEDHLGRRLLERTPRQVRLSHAGARFLEPARDLIAAGRRAAEAVQDESLSLALGVTHHLVGPGLPRLLRQIAVRDSGVTLHLRTGGTRALLDRFDAGELDAVVVLRHDESRRGGETLLTEPFGWYCAGDIDLPPGAPVPLAAQPEPCALRAMAVRALEAAGLGWREAFVGNGAAAAGAAASAGLAIAPLARRAAPVDTVDVGPRLGLPALPGREAVLHSQVSGARAAAVLRRITGAFRAM